MTHAVGVDVGSYTLKSIEVVRNGKSPKVTLVGSIYNPVGQFLPNDESQFNQLAGALHQLAEEQKFADKPVVTALPESLAYTNIISMPYLSDAELASSIHWEAEQHIPVPLDEVELEYQVLYKPKKGAIGEKMQVLLVAAKKTVVERVVQLFQVAGLELVGMETGLIACHRAVSPMIPTDQGVAILQVGALSTDVLIIESGRIMLSYAIQTGGLIFTRAIQQGLGLTGQQAEEYKRAYGYDATQLEGKVKMALDPVMNVLVGEIRKAIQYYQSSGSGAGIRTVVLSGGGSFLRGFAPYLTEALSAEVVTVNPFQGMLFDKNVSPPKDSSAYTIATGLAMN